MYGFIRQKGSTISTNIEENTNIARKLNQINNCIIIILFSIIN